MRLSRGQRAGAAALVPDDGRMSLVQHLRELRSRLVKSALALVVGVVLAYIFWRPLFDFLRQPYLNTDAGRKRPDLYANQVFGEFKVRLKVAFLAGILGSSPVWLYQLGAFITPALHRKERRYAAGFLGSSVVLFLVGAAFAYFSISQGLNFLLNVGGDGLVNLVDVTSYLSFVTLAILAFGLAFEFPVVVAFLNIVGVFPAQKMRDWRRGMIVAIFAASAVITPSQDPITFILMAIPICIMYEGCIIAARIRERRRRAADPLAGLPDEQPSAIAPAGPLGNGSLLVTDQQDTVDLLRAEQDRPDR